MDYSKRYLAKRAFYGFQGAVSALIYPYFKFKEQLFPQNEARILLYHSISQFPPEKDIPYDNVPPDLFEEHMRILKQDSFHIISLSQLLSRIRANANIQPRTIVITFDDGYKNNFLNAFPILRREGYRATFFLIAGTIGSDQPFKHLLWDHTSRDYFRKEPASRTPMNWYEVSKLVEGGNEIGSHGMTHRSLGQLTLEESSVEIRHSKQMIEKEINTTVNSFSYPFGSRSYRDFGETSHQLLRTAGYDGACSTEIGSVSRNDNPYELRRIAVREKDSAFFFRQKLIGAYDWVSLAKRSFQRSFPRIDRVS